MEILGISSVENKISNVNSAKKQRTFGAKLLLTPAADIFVTQDIYIKSGMKLKLVMPATEKFENLINALEQRFLNIGSKDSAISIDITEEVAKAPDTAFGKMVTGISKTLRLMIPQKDGGNFEYAFDYTKDNNKLLDELFKVSQEHCV